MLDRIEERRAIAKRIQDAKDARARVNAMPAVIKARAKADSARDAAEAAQREFRRVFDAHYPKNIDAALCDEYPELLAMGDSADEIHVFLCGATGLPIFEGDRIIRTGSGDVWYEQTIVLADAVQIDPDVGGADVTIANPNDFYEP